MHRLTITEALLEEPILWIDYFTDDQPALLAWASFGGGETLSTLAAADAPSTPMHALQETHVEHHGDLHLAMWTCTCTRRGWFLLGAGVPDRVGQQAAYLEFAAHAEDR